MITRPATDWMLLPLKRYAEFSGRSPRAEYWWFALFTFLISLPAAIADAVIGLPLFNPIVSLAILLPSLTLSVRRLHDLDHSGWWLLVPVVAVIFTLTFGFLAEPIATRLAGSRMSPGQGGAMMFVLIGWLAMLFLLASFCRRGTQGDNRFGPDPLAEAPNPTIYYG